ncbi:hypothetical protein EXIGLDRAFT_720515 [Exidia glandulosa HHB12029]|uniref:DUF6533 domain-containing protein n=1 Tax=Exidia glandulosa HHB12029 TaxID=1314781 RepID=A0A165GBM4_EXIGL|nr:hypothetical protein EXIGLDRAFT_720515 [Exidia glandulosa HHB12029]
MTEYQPTLEEIVAFVVSFLEIERSARYFSVATLTLVAYEYFITFEQEADYIYHWRGGWTAPSILFVFNRYFIIVLLIISNLMLLWPDPPDTFCLHAARFTGASGIIITTVVNISLTIRLYAFWHRSRSILIGVSILLVAGLIVSTVTSIISLVPVKPTPKFAPGLPTGCFLIPPMGTWIPLIPVLVFDTVMMVLTAVQARRLLQGTGASLQRQTPIVAHLFKTGTGYYVVIFGVTLFTSISSFASPHLEAVVPSSGILAAITSIMCSRLLLYIRSELQTAKTPRLSTATVGTPYDTTAERTGANFEMDNWQQDFRELEERGARRRSDDAIT